MFSRSRNASSHATSGIQNLHGHGHFTETLLLEMSARYRIETWIPPEDLEAIVTPPDELNQNAGEVLRVALCLVPVYSWRHACSKLEEDLDDLPVPLEERAMPNRNMRHNHDTWFAKRTVSSFQATNTTRSLCASSMPSRPRTILADRSAPGGGFEAIAVKVVAESQDKEWTHRTPCRLGGAPCVSTRI